MSRRVAHDIWSAVEVRDETSKSPTHHARCLVNLHTRRPLDLAIARKLAHRLPGTAGFDRQNASRISETSRSADAEGREANSG